MVKRRIEGGKVTFFASLLLDLRKKEALRVANSGNPESPEI